ncbi:MAG: hypothetical protein PHT32_04800 [Candidatus Omnitrophica bacterium]|nr:hypothetical protein [Candidatus Omnitrophota bacterium]
MRKNDRMVTAKVRKAFRTIIRLNVIGAVLIFAATVGFTAWFYSQNAAIAQLDEDIQAKQKEIDLQFTVLLNYQNLDIQAAVNNLGVKLFNDDYYVAQLRQTLKITLKILATGHYKDEQLEKWSTDELMEERRNAFEVFNSKLERLKKIKKEKEISRKTILDSRNRWYPVFAVFQVIGIVCLSVAQILELVIKLEENK